MYVRLAFSVAAHLESSILLLDEVIGVGDLEFKRKSLAKLRETVTDGRTIIIVSHQLEVLKDLCTKGVYLDQGRIRQTGRLMRSSIIMSAITNPLSTVISLHAKTGREMEK
jgi:lipopolysaccharide transport system ATP-binding protein